MKNSLLPPKWITTWIKVNNQENQFINSLIVGKKNEVEINLPPNHPIFPLTDNDKKITLS